MGYVSKWSKGLVSRCEMANRVGTSQQTFSTWVSRGVVPAPTHEHRENLYYRFEDEYKIRDAIKTHKAKKRPRPKAVRDKAICLLARAGFGQCEIAGWFRMKQPNISLIVKNGTASDSLSSHL